MFPIVAHPLESIEMGFSQSTLYVFVVLVVLGANLRWVASYEVHWPLSQNACTPQASQTSSTN
ncbi:hypothetical protein VCRA2121O68_70177 [Vibrio crassostreae]|nr:hypothetical protein VCRA2117O39_70177 [Vibrio crassostreae]CAK2578787.1 hypothetical protein VCRA2116O32_70177 [Vibrio crassostreae]CAK3395962.1 hypothetical protein VCRA2127O399_20279 [Vibrio crassostreae]CAK3793812.1 hypothetical protein VCRA2122O392_10528 [Vibrio crassostreae]CAK4011430.1 hypothetical protein VCRA2121O69_70076 [Vibrio crassostreae]